MKLTNKAHSFQRLHVQLDVERVALLDRDETLDISLDAGSHTFVGKFHAKTRGIVERLPVFFIFLVKSLYGEVSFMLYLLS